MAAKKTCIFSASPSVVWKTELPPVGERCKSPTFSLLPSFELQFQIKGYGNKHREEGWHFFVRQLGMESDFVIRTYIQTDKGKYENFFTRTIDKSSLPVDYLFCISRNNFLESYSFEGEGDNVISLLFLFDRGVNRTRTTNVPEELQPIKKEDGSEEVSIQSLSLEKISEDIGKLYDTKEHSDVMLMCDNAVFPAHRNILSARSDVFAAMFANEMSEKKTGVVEIVNTKSSVLELFLQYIYTGRTADELSVEAAIELYEAADKYEVHLLKRMCRPIIVGNLSEEVACRALHLADRFRDSALLDAAVSLVAEKADFLRTAEWKSFAELHKDLAMKVFFKFFEK